MHIQKQFRNFLVFPPCSVFFSFFLFPGLHYTYFSSMGVFLQGRMEKREVKGKYIGIRSCDNPGRRASANILLTSSGFQLVISSCLQVHQASFL